MNNHFWKIFYKIAGLSSLISAALIPVAGIFFFLYPPPGFDPTNEITIGWFNLFHSNWLAGLFNLDLVMVIDNVLVIPVFIALFVILRKINEPLMILALVIGLVGIAGYFAVNPAFSMLSLSKQYATAQEIDKTTLVAAGQAILALYQGTGFLVYMYLVSAAGIIIAAVMLQTKIFSRWIAYAGILGNVLNPAMFLPAVGLYIGLLTLIPLMVWYIAIGWKLYQLGRESKT
jgi:hypothetical protein